MRTPLLVATCQLAGCAMPSAATDRRTGAHARLLSSPGRCRVQW
jgi:hypothetical protein